MLPFSTKRIFRNRWWAVVFAVSVCWAAVDFAGGDAPPAPANAGANAGGVDATDFNDVQALVDKLEKMD